MVYPSISARVCDGALSAPDPLARLDAVDLSGCIACRSEIPAIVREANASYYAGS